MIKHLDLFSGIGGFALATEMAWGGSQVEHVFCDNEPFSQAILKKHWPNSQIHGDIRQVTAHTVGCGHFHGESQIITAEAREQTFPKSSTGCGRFRVDILTGGFPCQPFSQAGRRRGTEDDRHLWPEMLRVIREFHPRWVIGENVGGFVTWNDGLVLEQVHADLEGEGYEVQAFIIPAVSLNAPHRRDRVWIVAHATSDGSGGRPEEVCKEDGGQDSELHSESDNADCAHDSDSKRTRRKGSSEKDQGRSGQPHRHGFYEGGSWAENWLEVATQLCTLDDGLPNGLARPRGWRNAALKGAGNAIVPQVAAEIMRVIRSLENESRNKQPTH